MLENYPQYIQYTSYFVLFLIAQSFSIWGQYVTLPFKSLTYWEAIKMALPYAWVTWFFMTFAINIGHSNDLVTPTQNIFLLIILQFSLILIMNYVGRGFPKCRLYLTTFQVIWREGVI